MSSLPIQLPDALKTYAQAAASERGYESVSEFIQDLLEADRERLVHAEVEKVLAKRIDGPFSDLTDEDFASIRKEGRRIIQEHRGR